jgi:hypothetical protein
MGDYNSDETVGTSKCNARVGYSDWYKQYNHIIIIIIIYILYMAAVYGVYGVYSYYIFSVALYAKTQFALFALLKLDQMYCGIALEKKKNVILFEVQRMVVIPFCDGFCGINVKRLNIKKTYMKNCYIKT